MLGGRRRCSCKHGVLFSLLSLAPASVSSKKLWNRNFISIFQDIGQHTWEQSHRNRSGKELRSTCSLSSWPEHIYLRHVSIWDFRLETLPSIQMLHSLIFMKVFVKSNSNHQCCNTGLRVSISRVGFPRVTSSTVLLVSANPLVLCLGPYWALLSLSWVRLEECRLPQQRIFPKSWINLQPGSWSLAVAAWCSCVAASTEGAVMVLHGGTSIFLVCWRSQLSLCLTQGQIFCQQLSKRSALPCSFWRACKDFPKSQLESTRNKSQSPPIKDAYLHSLSSLGILDQLFVLDHDVNSMVIATVNCTQVNLYFTSAGWVKLYILSSPVVID